MQLPQSLIENRHAGGDERHDESADSERVLRAEMVRGRAREDVSDRHRAHKRENKHAHHAATHLIGHELLQQRVSDRDRAHERKTQPEKKQQRQRQPRQRERSP